MVLSPRGVERTGGAEQKGGFSKDPPSHELYKTQHTVSHTAKHCSVTTDNDNHRYRDRFIPPQAITRVLFIRKAGISGGAGGGKPASSPCCCLPPRPDFGRGVTQKVPGKPCTGRPASYHGSERLRREAEGKPDIQKSKLTKQIREGIIALQKDSLQKSSPLGSFK